MLGDLSPDLIGTAPKQPPVVDHSWLNPVGYDNYPSDNVRLRILPKLSELWNHAPAQNGINLIPNSTVKPLAARVDDDAQKAGVQIVREAKKAIMAGLKGKDLARYLRARFSSSHIANVSEELKKVAEEIGLLGNVYIDASAFNSYEDAEKFLCMHRTRLARDILVAKEGLSENVTHLIANTFHKNVVASMEYNEKLFQKYHDHLVAAGRIPSDFVIDSKESLRQAFLYVKPQVEKAEAAPVKAFNAAEVSEGLGKLAVEKAIAEMETKDVMRLGKARDIASFVQEQLSKGKSTAALKEMMRSKFALTDVSDVQDVVAIVVSKEGLTDKNIDAQVSEGKLSTVMASELKKIGREFPIRQARYEDTGKSTRMIGVPGFFYTGSSGKKDDGFGAYRTASLEALKKGFAPVQIISKLSKKITAEQATEIVSEAVAQLNAVSAGVVANPTVKVESKVMVPELKAHQTLPDPKTIVSQSMEVLSFFHKDANESDIEIGGPIDFSSMVVDDLRSSKGLDISLS